jgi:radical SAM protein with 4Fe4S-binding SPASM domain
VRDGILAEVEFRQAYAVWEITTRCNLACVHCGSRAGPARHDELTTEEALELVPQLAELGVTEVILLGGEVYVRRDWETIATALREAGMLVTMTTGAWGLTPAMARRLADAGISLVSVSMDGLEESHDRLRGRRGSWRQCLAALGHLREAGVVPACNTQINRLSAPELPRVYDALVAEGMRAWQIQLTGPMGRAADNSHLILQPVELLDLFPVLARIARRCLRDGVVLTPADNVGYYGPYERLLRSGGARWGFWQGPGDGLSVIGIESDGSIKAEPTLPSEPFRGGNVRERPLREIVESSSELTFNLGAGTPDGTAHLWGFCRTCEFAQLCRAGCQWMSFIVHNRRGNNPYCHHRALTLAARGRRERVVQVAPAPGLPFDIGEFRLVEEAFDAPWPEPDPLRFSADQVAWPPHWEADDGPTAGPVSRPPAPVRRARRDDALLPRSAWPSSLDQFAAVLRARRLLVDAEAQSSY